MFCPLCRAEFRSDVRTCATCGAPLVASLEADNVKENPPRLLWIGKDSVEFDLVVGALSSAEIPARPQKAVGGLIGALLKSQAKIHVLQSDFARALEVAAEAAAARRHGFGMIQTCHSCGAEFSASLASCLKCKTVLMVERSKDSKASVSPEALAETAMKYCPVCDASYLPAHEQCTVCGVELVPEEFRGSPFDEKERHRRLEVVWKGGDPIAFSQAIAALRAAGIRHHVQSTHDYFVFGLAIPRPRYVLRVIASDADRARDLLAGINDSFAFSLEESPAPPEENGSPPPRHAADWDPSKATSEVWNGEDSALAAVLEACLRENDIGVRRRGIAPGILHLLVMPSDTDAAREILRELREGTPPA